jgi:hypothetical protein
VTTISESFELPWRGTKDKLARFFDTPGLFDTKGEDTKHIAAMVAKLKK